MKRFNPFPANDWHHNEGRGGIGPPPAQKRVEQQTAYENGGKESTEIGLSGIGVHGAAVERDPDRAFRLRKQGHYYQSGTRDDNADDAVFRRLPVYQVVNRFIRDVDPEGNEAEAYHSQGQALIPLATMDVSIDGHAPEQGRAGRDFDETVHPEAYKRDTARHGSRDCCRSTLEQVPSYREVLEASSTAN